MIFMFFKNTINQKIDNSIIDVWSEIDTNLSAKKSIYKWTD